MVHHSSTQCVPLIVLLWVPGTRIYFGGSALNTVLSVLHYLSKAGAGTARSRSSFFDDANDKDPHPS